ncbi:hypothetical protein DY000_02012517 [Brassica cretica]|uniref:Uncharacterized protein n=1 Tax=Brassica cretica TaxID=69181 RepID=A0ABQ7CPB1_BRACR|nr:hypothetical protein DY000_02012517 [Brassica cretica]
MSISTWPDISHLAISKPELINVLRQMGPHVKWPQKMKIPESFWNPNRWCDFHNDHGHKTEDCVALRIEVNELLKKRHRQEFLSDKAKNLLNKEDNNQPTGAVPASPPRQDRVIHVISDGSEVSGISHAAAKKSTRHAKNGHKTGKTKHLLLGTDEISFTAKEQERVLAPHQDALVISLAHPVADVMPVLLNSGQFASREAAVEEMKDCRSMKQHWCRSTVMPEYGLSIFYDRLKPRSNHKLPEYPWTTSNPIYVFSKSLLTAKLSFILVLG